MISRVPKVKKIQKIDVYTDGSCINQGKRNAKAAFAVFFGDDDPRNYSEKLNSNCKQDSMLAELEALRHALYVISKQIDNRKKQNKKQAFTIYSDCTNAIQWILGSNTPARKLEPTVTLCRSYYSQIVCKTSLSILHVRAHSGVYGNNRADRMAYRMAHNACKS
ncbi:hypothetical protein CANINC_002429 [Pichia inconspicua]|uniref:RNase H type-1 domain-containing protein n=1 Tax=Pichia inconspicua TaxID=52247 RepID=A0A4V4NFQ7_9ASCO|nr:hypothetical protein CANINC_002429 [[Candida] inconspicua]